MSWVWLAIYALVIFIAILIAELAEYIWHRYIAHTSKLTPIIPEEVLTSHRFHHRSSFSHDASEDFIWILIGLCGITLAIGLAWFLGLARWIDSGIVICLLIAVSIVFLINWYVHKLVHTPEHFLGQTEYIKDMRTIHKLHHRYPDSNYSILAFYDTTFDSHTCGVDRIIKRYSRYLDSN